jgi:ribosomal protein L7/L12
LDYQLSLVRRQVDTLAGHLGVASPKPKSTGVLDELRRGRKIQAIKAYRMETGAGLAEAKSAVEDLARRSGL